MKKTVTLFIIIVMCFLCSCKHIDETPAIEIEPFTVEAGAAAFVQHRNVSMPVSLSAPINLARYTIENFNIDKGLIVLSTERTETSAFTKAYAVTNLSGEFIIPFTLDSSKDRVFLTINNNIIITYDLNNLYTIYDLNGTVLLSNISCEAVSAIGNYHFKVSYEDESAQVYDLSGKGIFINPSVYPFADGTFYSCGSEYILITTTQAYHNIFDSFGSLVKSYRDTENTKYRICYLNANRFLVIENITVTSADSYELNIEIGELNKYMNQNVYIYDAISNTETEIAIEFIYEFVNQYNYSFVNKELNEGYNYLSYYNIEEDKTVNVERPYSYTITDINLKYMIRFSDNGYPLIYYRDGKGFEKNGLKARMVALDAAISWQNLEDSINTILGYNDERLIVGKTIDNEFKYGAYSSAGSLIVDYEYDALSVFCGGYAIGQKDELFYSVDLNGAATLIDMEIIAFNSMYGVYIVEENNYQKLYNNAGLCLIDLNKFAVSIQFYTDYNNNSFISVTDTSNNLTVYKLN